MDAVTGSAPALEKRVLVSDEEAAELDARFERSGPMDVMRWAIDTIPEGRLVMSSTFGVGGMVLIHLLGEEGIRVPVVFVDTLYHFPETIEHAERVADRYGLDLRIQKPAESRRTFEAEHGPKLWERDEELFHKLTKLDPMSEALSDVDGWITGRRRDQSSTRERMPYVEVGSWIKVNPIANWTYDAVWDFIKAHKVPYNPLHDLGYASIGDAPLTTPIRPGEHERAGRWRGSSRLECGLHGI